MYWLLDDIIIRLYRLFMQLTEHASNRLFISNISWKQLAASSATEASMPAHWPLASSVRRLWAWGTATPCRPAAWAYHHHRTERHRTATDPFCAFQVKIKFGRWRPAPPPWGLVYRVPGPTDARPWKLLCHLLIEGSGRLHEDNRRKRAGGWWWR
jgi:hypothetical protein